MRLAAALCVVSMAGWLLGAHHVPEADAERARFFSALAAALFNAGVIWLFYLAAEPQVRRIWPHILITWSRLLSGRLRDPMVGRDLLTGATVGAAMTVVTYLSYFVPDLLHWPAAEPHAPGLGLLAGPRYLGATVFFRLSAAIENAMLGVLGLALLRVLLTRVSPVLGRTGVVFAVATALFTPLAANGQFNSGVLALDLLFGALLVALVLGALLRDGLFAGIVTFFTHFLTWNALATFDPSRQYFPIATAAVALVAAIAVLGFVLARGQQPVFGRVVD